MIESKIIRCCKHSWSDTVVLLQEKTAQTLVLVCCLSAGSPSAGRKSGLTSWLPHCLVMRMNMRSDIAVLVLLQEKTAQKLVVRLLFGLSVPHALVANQDLHHHCRIADLRMKRTGAQSFKKLSLVKTPASELTAQKVLVRYRTLDKQTCRTSAMDHCIHRRTTDSPSWYD